MKSGCVSGLLVLLIAHPSSAQLRAVTPLTADEQDVASAPEPTRVGCEALITCDAPATLVAEGDWRDGQFGFHLEANNHVILASAPQRYFPMNDIRMLTQQEDTWFDAGWLSVEGFTGGILSLQSEEIAASGDLVAVVNADSTSVFLCNAAGCQLDATIDSAAPRRVATNGKEIAINSPAETSVYSREETGNWIRTATLSSGSTCQWGLVAMDENRIATGCGTNLSVFVRNGLNWEFEQQLIRPTAQFVVGSLAIKGSSILAADCPQQECLPVHAFELIDGHWTPTQLLPNAGADFWSGFGSSIVIAGDYAVVGAPYQSYSGWSLLGAVHVYRRTAGQWILARMVRPPSFTGFSWFGFSVAVFQDKLLVSAPAEDCRGNCNGRLYAYGFTGSDCDCDDVADVCEVDEDLDGISACDGCPESIVDPFVAIGDCITGVPNEVFDDGCSMADLIEQCEQQPHLGRMPYRCINRLVSDWRREGLVNANEARQIRQCLGAKPTPRGKP